MVVLMQKFTIMSYIVKRQGMPCLYHMRNTNGIHNSYGPTFGS